MHTCPALYNKTKQIGQLTNRNTAKGLTADNYPRLSGNYQFNNLFVGSGQLTRVLIHSLKKTGNNIKIFLPCFFFSQTSSSESIISDGCAVHRNGSAKC